MHLNSFLRLFLLCAILAGGTGSAAAFASGGTCSMESSGRAAPKTSESSRAVAEGSESKKSPYDDHDNNEPSGTLDPVALNCVGAATNC